MLLTALAALAATNAGAVVAASVSRSTQTPEFSAILPDGWSPRRDSGALRLSGPSDENRLRALIVVRYYPPDDKTFSGADAYVRRQSAATMFDPPDAKPAAVAALDVAGRKARRIVRELTATADPGKMNAREIASREELVVVPGERGFYVLSYSAPTSLFDKNRTAFTALLKAFKPKK